MRQLTWLLLTCGTIFLSSCANSSGSSTASGDPASGNASATGSGDDIYYELTTKTSSSQVNMNMTTKMYLTHNGDMRSEMTMINSRTGKDVPTILIGHLDKPYESIDLDPEKKTYTVNHIDSNDLNDHLKKDIEVTKIGEEKVNGYDCVHARVITRQSLGSMMPPLVDTMDLWKSKDVPTLPAFQKVYDRMFRITVQGGADATDKLKAAGCEGFVVKMTIGSKHTAMTMDLTKVEKNSFPGSLFEIPSGYTEDKSGR